MQQTTNTRENPERLIHAAEAHYAKNPKSYKRKLLGLSVLGYAFLLGAWLLLMTLSAVTIGSVFEHSSLMVVLLKQKLILLGLVLISVIGRALWVRFPRPEGYELSPEECPRLFKTVGQLQKQLKTATVHRVVIVPEFNAAMVQPPRLGILGWPQNTLIIGLELMMATTPEQLTSVLAHELGHLSSQHGSFGAWIHRIRNTWSNIMQTLDHQQIWGSGLFRAFFNWYAPYFNAYSFVLARHNEYEADALAAASTSVQTTATALLHTRVYNQYGQERYWSRLDKRVERQAHPPGKIYEGLSAFYQQGIDDEQLLQRYLHQALTEHTHAHDTHPALKDRLAALKVPLTSLTTFKKPKKSAAAWFLACKLKPVVQYFSSQWQQQQQADWHQRHHQSRMAQNKLTSLERQIKQSEPVEDEALWQLAVLSEEFRSRGAALGHYKRYLKRHPKEPEAHFAIGRLLLKESLIKST